MEDQLKKVIEKVSELNLLANSDSLSGRRFNLEHTTIIRWEIPLLAKKYAIKTMLNGKFDDLFWILEILLQLYNIKFKYTWEDIVSFNFTSVMIKFVLSDVKIVSVRLMQSQECFIKNVNLFLKNIIS